MISAGNAPKKRLGFWVRQQGERRGAAAVEFAVVLPLMLLLIFGLIEFGRYMMVAQTLVNMSREGARMAAQGDFTVNQVRNEMQSQIDEIYNNGNAFTIDITSNGAAVPNGDIDTQVARGQPIRVTITVDYSDVTLLPGGSFVFDNDFQIRGRTTMRRE